MLLQVCHGQILESATRSAFDQEGINEAVKRLSLNLFWRGFALHRLRGSPARDGRQQQ